jgi:hypothetical protein
LDQLLVELPSDLPGSETEINHAEETYSIARGSAVNSDNILILVFYILKEFRPTLAGNDFGLCNRRQPFVRFESVSDWAEEENAEFGECHRGTNRKVEVIIFED